jgi:methyl coenzyme M reductase subunit D
MLEVPAREIRQEKETKGIQIGKKKVELCLFAGDMILYTENSKESTKNTELMFAKAVGCKINIQAYLLAISVY